MTSSRLSIISNPAFVVVGISALHAVAIVAIALLEADCRSFNAARWASVGRMTRSIHRTCHSYRPTERGVQSRLYPLGPVVPGPVNTPGMRTMASLSADGEGDCCAAAGTPPTTDVITHTPVTTSTLLIKFIICAHPRKLHQLHHRLSHRLCGGLHLSDRLPRRTRMGSRRLGGEAVIRRAESVAALSRRLISNALVRRSRVPPHRRGGAPPPLSVVLGSKTAKVFARSRSR